MSPGKRSRGRLRSALALAALSNTFGLDAAFGAGGTWTYNGNDNWSTLTAWFGFAVADGASQIAGFGVGGPSINPLDTLQVNLDTSRTLGSIFFGDGDGVVTPAGWRIVSPGGNTLTLQTTDPATTPVLSVTELGVGNGTSAIGTLFQKIANINVSIASSQGIFRNGLGTLVLSANNSGLGGHYYQAQGVTVLGHANAMGSATVTVLAGQLAFRNDVGTTYGTTIVLQGDSTFGIGNSIGTNGIYGSGFNQVHSIGDVTLDTYGITTLGVSGSNGYGLNMGRLTLRNGVNLINQGDVGEILGAGGGITSDSNNNINGLGSGALTVGTITYGGSGSGTINLGGVGSLAGNITVTNGITSTGGGSAALVYSGSRTATIAGAIGTGGDTYVTGGTTGPTNNFQSGVGTLVVGVGALPSNRAVTINGGTLLLNGGALTHNVTGIRMGGATLTSGVVPAFLNSGAGTVVLGSNGIVVNDSVLFDVANTVASANATAANITGRLDLGGANQNIVVNGISTLTLDAIVNGAGGIVKTGTGALNLTNTNTFTGSIDVQDGVVAGTVKGAGNALGSIGANVSLGGRLRMNGTASAGSGAVNIVSIKDTGIDTGLIVDASAGGVTTLSINNLTGREAGTRGTIKVVPVTGSLNTNEIVNISINSLTGLANGMLPAYIAVQNSGTNTQLGFASLSSNRIVAFTNYQTGTIAGATTILDQTADDALPGAKTLFGLRMGANRVLSGSSGVLTLGNGTSGFGGLIMNGGANLSVGTLQPNGSDELVIWSGGTGVNSISSNLNLLGDLTTGGSQALLLSGTANFNSVVRNLTVTGAPVTLSNASAISGSLVKRGGGILVLSGDNTINTGTTTIQSGTLQLGAGGATGGLGSGTIVNNANLSINRNVTGSFSNAVSGSGNVWVNMASTAVLTASGTLTNTGTTGVQGGTLRPGGPNILSSTSTLRVESGGTFDLNGNSQTVNTISGLGTIVNNGSGVGAQATLTINSGGTFDGAIRNGTAGSISLAKSGPGTLVLTSPDSLFNGTIAINGGVLELRHGNAAGINRQAQINPNNANQGDQTNINTPPIILNDAQLVLDFESNIPANLAPIATGVSFNLGTASDYLRRNILIQQGTTGTISLATKPNPSGKTGSGTLHVGVTNSSINPTYNQDGQTNINGFLLGGGTLVLDLNGRQLDIGVGTNNNAASQWNNFTGTVIFPDSNPAGSKLRMSMDTANFTTGNGAATWNFGSGFNTINIRNGTTTFNMGFVSGGTNTVMTGCENGLGRPSIMMFGNLPGDQTFHGSVRNSGSGMFGGVSPAGLTKVGSFSSLTLTNSHTYTLNTTVNHGTLILGPGGDLQQTASVNILPASTTAGLSVSTFAFGGGTMSGTGLVVNVGTASTATQTFTGALVVPNGFVTPPGTTFIGGGTIYGNLNHSSGTMNPSGAGTIQFGTLTFANDLSFSAGGNMDFNVTNGSINVLGGGVNDLIRVLPNDGLSLNGGTIRVNFSAGTSNLVVGTYYPLIQFSGNVGGGGTASLEAFAALALVHGSLKMVQGTGSLANTVGARVEVVGGATVDLTWAPTTGNVWDIVTTKNFKPTGGAGSLLFFNTDSATFDDSTTVRTVELAASGFQPHSITVNTSNTYTFTGDGTITGSASLVKKGSGTLEVTRAGYNFTGGATIEEGTIFQNIPAGGNALGLGTIVFNGNSGYVIAAPNPNQNQAPPGANNVEFNGNNFVFFPTDNQATQNLNWNFFGEGTVTLQKPAFIQLLGGGNNLITLNGNLTSFGGTIKVTDASLGNNVRLNSGGANNTTGGPSMTLDLGIGTINVVHRNAGAPMTWGALRGGPNTAVSMNGAGVLTIGNKESSTFQGVINGGATSQVIKTGSFSTLTLTNLQPFTGLLNVNQGTLALVNSSANPLATPTIIIGTDGVLDVTGLSNGNGILTLNANQRIVSNGDVLGNELQVVSTSTVGGTQYNIPLVVDDAATISPGNSVGTMTVANLLLDGQVDFLIEVDQTGIDTLVLSGTQTTQIVNAVSALHLVNLGGFVPGTYTFLDYDGDPEDQGPIEGGFQLAPEGFAYEVKVLHDSINTQVLLQFVNNSAQWFVNSDGQWSTPPNWTLDGTNPATLVPNSVTFGTFIDAPRTVTVNSTIGNVANSIIFESPHSYTIAGTGTLTMDSGIVAPITVNQGNHAINTTVRALRTLGVSVPSGLTLSFGGTVINANNAGVSKVGGGTASFVRLNMPGGTLNVGAGSVIMTTKPGPNNVSGTNVLANVTIAPGASVDLTNNAMILDYAGAIGSILTDLRAELADGRLFSSTVGSDQALGYRNNQTGTTPAGGTGTAGLGLATSGTFGGVTGVDGTSVLIRVTYKGDSNLDGVVNLIDLFNLSLNWLSTNGVWAGGDFNYDGLVNKADLAILAQGWQLGQDSPLPSDSLEAALTAAGLPLNAVPEPGTLAVAGVGALGLLTRRRRKV